ncbi:MAG: choice-of-anchor V domain-containing protein [Bacteroidota bacterium]
MKKLITFSIILLTSLGAFITFTNESYKKNGRAGNTGSPGEATCQTGGCHNGTVNTGTGNVNILSSDMTGWEYVPGTTYNIRVRIAETGKLVFGLGVEVLNSSNTNAGTINILESSRTQIISSGAGRLNLTHMTGAGLTNDSSVYTFSWTAPSTDIGPVTFYVAGLAGNNNNGDSGDQSYTTSQTCTAKTNVGIQTPTAASTMNIYPNPVQDKINIQMNNTPMNQSTISILDMSGKVVSVLASNLDLNENQLVSYTRPASLKEGLYLLQISNRTTTKSTRLVIQ